MRNNETGLLTVAMHACVVTAVPFPMVSVETVLQAFTFAWGDVRESQLRGSGGVSPRFPSISLRNR